MSSEDLKAIYERKKKMKAKEPFHLERTRQFFSSKEICFDNGPINFLEVTSQTVVTSDNKHLLFCDDENLIIFDLETKQKAHCFETAQRKKPCAHHQLITIIRFNQLNSSDI